MIKFESVCEILRTSVVVRKVHIIWFRRAIHPHFQNIHCLQNLMATFESIQTGNIHIDEGERNIEDLSPLAKDRINYKPRYPSCFENPEKVNVVVS